MKKNYEVVATLSLELTLEVEAEDQEEVREIVEGMSLDEYLDYVGSDELEITHIGELGKGA